MNQVQYVHMSKHISLLKEHNVNALLISDFFDILYVTGFRSMSPLEREAFVVLTKEHMYLVTDRRYKVEENEKLMIRYIEPKKTVVQTIQEIVQNERIKTFGFESHSITVEEKKSLEKLSAELIPVNKPFVQLRSVKTKDEQKKIKHACFLLDRALHDLIAQIRIGMREKDIAWVFESLVRTKYQAHLAFEPIIAIDENSSIPHYDVKQDGNAEVKNKSMILIDAGVQWQNYCSDITRMVVVGNAQPHMLRTYNDLRNIQEQTIKQIKEHSLLRQIDLYGRKEVEKKRYLPYPHSTGHGVGLEVHESPRVRSTSEDKKLVGQVITIEPGIYIPKKWGMRIEDTVLILPDGSPEVLTRFSKDLVQIQG